jgi:hypothetical protein
VSNVVISSHFNDGAVTCESVTWYRVTVITDNAFLHDSKTQSLCFKASPMEGPYQFGEGFDIGTNDYGDHGDEYAGPYADAQLAQQLAAESIQATFR